MRTPIFPNLGKILNTAASRNEKLRKPLDEESKWKALSYARGPFLLDLRLLLAKLFHDCVEHFFRGTGHGIRQGGQGFIYDIEHIDKVWRLGIDVEDARQHFALIVSFGEPGHGANLIGWIEVFFQLAQVQAGAI